MHQTLLEGHLSSLIDTYYFREKGLGMRLLSAGQYAGCVYYGSSVTCQIIYLAQDAYPLMTVSAHSEGFGAAFGSFV